MPIKSTLITNHIVELLEGITAANGYPIELRQVLRGKFYEDLQDAVPLPVAGVVALSSGPVTGQQAPAGAQRQRQLQIEVVVDLDNYPGLTRDAVLDAVEWSLGKALGGAVNGRGFGGLALSAGLGDCEFNYPSPAHSLAIVQAVAEVTYLEHYR